MIAVHPIEALLLELAASAEFRGLLAALSQPASSNAEGQPVRASGLTDAAKALFAVLLRKQARSPVFFVTVSNEQAERSFDLLQAWTHLLNEPDPVLLPAHDIRPYDGLSPHADISEKRALALAKVTSGDNVLVAMPIAAAAGRAEPPEFYRCLVRQIRRGEMLDLEGLLEHLAAVGYTAHDPVEMPGQFSARGGILDVYSPEARRPVRLELFGDEVESLREFDPETQRSVGPVERISLLPLTEFPVRRQILEKITEQLHGDSEHAGARADTFVEPFPGWEFHVPLAQPRSHTFLDLCKSAILVLDEPGELERQMERLWVLLDDEYHHAEREATNAVPPEQFYLRWEEFEVRARQEWLVHTQQLAWSDGTPEEAPVFDFATRAAPNFHGSLPLCLAEIQKMLDQQFRVVVLTGGAGESERLAELLAENRVAFRRAERNAELASAGALGDAPDLEMPACWIARGGLPHGVSFPAQRLLILGQQDLFESSPAASRPLIARSATSVFLSDFRDLDPGDCLVHLEHGIGAYHGLKEIATEGVPQEFMEIEYREGDRLYVPLTRLDLVQKYRGTDGARPPLDRLGGATWARTQTRVKKAMREMAEELIKLYAQRQMAEGITFKDENPWQHEMEEAFEFDETPDQLRTIEEVRRDMEKPSPMDRLICGDVGYGKTEIAMRAAFRVALHDKQVAVLAPTTVLAFQHYETFRRRFAAFPVRVELLSRFRSTAEQKQVLKELEAGKVDVVIGTHRLLSKDVVFHDLGLLIVDEEQRFGVRHKERIKDMKKSVDVLSLSATPIPRTLHMALTGLRDMSLIETPPKDRLAIQTVVAPFNESLVRTAIGQELERGGQVYFVHNRVESLPAMVALVEKLVPQARIGMAHGQMNERHLEKVMMAFLRGETNVLVATTIIENGLDIPSVNTMIVNRADRMGLGELYQLRGRVGRSNRRAYAYLLVPPEGELTPIARRRLSALKEFSELGSGFRVAALDMELRGAGNLLGGQQHGQVNAIGLELYCQLLDEAVHELRGEPSRPTVNTTINLGLDIRIPPAYIPEEHQRLRMYKVIGSVRSSDDLAGVSQELQDRYGALPPPVRNLLDYAELKLVAEKLLVQSIERKKETVEIGFPANAEVDPARLMRFVSARPDAQFSPSGVLRIRVNGKAQEIIPQLRGVLEQLQN